MNKIALGIKATTLTPFAYHSLMVQNGSATLPELISDRAMAFGLAATLGMLRASVALPMKNYRVHLSAMPWRTSVFMTPHPRLLPPLIRRLNLDGEAGIKRKIQDVAKKGNLKDFFQIQEVPEGQVFRGAIFGFNPFDYAQQPRLVIRIGLHRNGMVLLESDEAVEKVTLNAATAALFDCQLSPGRDSSDGKVVKRYCLHGLQLSREYELEEALGEVMKWQ